MPIETRIFFSTLLDFSLLELKNINIDTWLDGISHKIPDSDSIKLMTFLLALGFSVKNFYPVIIHAFEPIHQATENGEVAWDSWRLLESYLPSLWWDNWDRCERLRRGLVEKFIRNDWPVKYFFETVKKKEILKEILKYCKKSYTGKHFIKELKEYAKKNPYKLNESQKSVVS